MPLKIIHDRKRCIGCNSCVSIAPQTWTMDFKEGKSLLTNATIKKDLYIAEIFDCDEADNKLAADCCPTGCIKVNSN